MHRHTHQREGGPERGSSSRRIRLCALLLAGAAVLGIVALAAPPAALAAPAAGEPLFYPCTSCHPIEGTGASAARKLPNGFAGHRIELVGHDALGEGKRACAVCHDAADADPGKLKLADGSTVDITGNISGVCYRCHSDKHAEWEAGAHGKSRPKCTSAGCHDPHSPGAIYAPPVTPFIGTGFQVQVLPEREPFVPLAPPAGPPPVETPVWLTAMAVLGVLAAAVAAGSLSIERSK